MNDRLKGAYWKLWHDTKSRFFISLLLVAFGLFGVFAPRMGNEPKPQACISAPNTLTWQQLRGLLTNPEVRSQLSKSPRHLPSALRLDPQIMPMGMPGTLQIADADVLATHCSANALPNLAYAASMQLYARITKTNIWGAMVYLFLFIGILLSVGPPFSGESMEAFSLTFSLPWSREKWLTHRVALSVGLLIMLTAIVFTCQVLKLHAPYMGQMRGGYPGVVGEIAGEVSPAWAFLAGLVGIALGTMTSLFTRSVLTAAVSASLIAYGLIAIDFVTPSHYRSNVTPLDLAMDGTMPIVLVLLGAGLLITSRLRNTDF